MSKQSCLQIICALNDIKSVNEILQKQSNVLEENTEDYSKYQITYATYKKKKDELKK